MRFCRRWSLSIALLGIFAVLTVGQSIAGYRVMSDDLRRNAQPPISYFHYLGTGMCWESLAENWESEFLEMGAFVWLTSFLHQKGSPESRNPDEDEDAAGTTPSPNSPWPARCGGWVRAVYARSLSLAFLVLFFCSFSIHAVAGAAEYNRHQRLHGAETVTALGFIGTSDFWFQSLQNWQSEFLGIASMVLLSIWLRQEGSPESKPVDAPHESNE